MWMYYKKTPFVSDMFRDRVKTALELASIKDSSVVLDVGCADGYVLKKTLEINDSCKCYGVDVLEKNLKEIPNCDIRVADARNLPFADKFFDIVFVLDMLEHVKDFEQIINEIKRVLKPNGCAILSGPTETWFYKFCRFLWLRKFSEEFHLYSIYEIEKKFPPNGFELIKTVSLPRFLIPELFRISKFIKCSK